MLASPMARPRCIKITLAREVLKDYRPSTSLFPDYHSVAAEARAWELYGDQLGE